MKVLRFAAIDIGSNSIRLLFMDALESGQETIFNKTSLIREQLRLGEDVFNYRMIREFKVDKLEHIMMAFRHLILANDVLRYRACATAAMREASNGLEIIDRIWKESGISIDIISPEDEARIIYSYELKDLINRDRNYLYVDVGGGDTVVTIVSRKQAIDSRSFPIGTIRLLHELVTADQFEEMNDWLLQCCRKYPRPEIIATGGDINKAYRFTEKPSGKHLTYKELDKLTNYIKSFTFEDRIKFLGLNFDRADVITIAIDIYLRIMKLTGSTVIWVPQIGLADGIVQQLYEEYKRESYI